MRRFTLVSAGVLAAVLALVTPLLWRSVPVLAETPPLDDELPVPASGDSALSMGAGVRP